MGTTSNPIHGPGRTELDQNTLEARRLQRYLDDMSPVVTDKLLDIVDTYSLPIKVDGMIDEDIISSYNYPNILTYNASSEYNFYTDYFEENIKNNSVMLESGLPSLYVVGDKKNLESPKYMNIATVGGIVKIQPTREDSVYEYFDEYAKQYKNAINSRRFTTTVGPVQNQDQRLYNLFNQLTTKQSRIYFNKTGMRSFKEINENRFLMPFQNNIKFKTHGPSHMAGILEDSDFIDHFCKELAARPNLLQPITLDIITDNVSVQNEVVQLTTISGTQELQGLIFTKEDAFIEQIKSLILATETNILELGTSGSMTPMQNNTVSTNSFFDAIIAENQKSSIVKAIKLNIFVSRLRAIIKNSKLKPQAFFNSSYILSDIFMYELVKVVKEGTIPIQTFYMPNLNYLEKIDFFDSQVKFEKNYDYILNCFGFCLNQKLDLSSISDPVYFRQVLEHLVNEDPSVAEIIIKYGDQMTVTRGFIPQLTDEEAKIILVPLIKKLQDDGREAFTYSYVIFKKNLFTEEAVVYDHPPSPPEVEIDGFMGVDNKIFFTLKNSITEYKAKPILIEPEDTAIFNKNMVSQKLKSLDDLMMFDGDDRIQYFKIYRLDFHPQSYTDFTEFFEAPTTTNIVDDSDQFQVCDTVKADHSTYTDTIQPNKKYYYTFRSVDIHGNISNPTKIYEVELINSEGTIFPIIKTVDLAEPDYKQNSRTFKRFLYITPTPLQSMINEKETGYFDENGNIVSTANMVRDNVKLGLTENSIWNKNYRLKIKSKITGKIVELDFKFIPKTVQNDNICE